MEAGGSGGEEQPSEGWKKSPAPAAAGGSAAEGGSGSRPPKRQMKSPYQLEVLEKTYAEEQYPSEATRQALSVKIGLSDRQLQMWFCHRRLKDRKPQPLKRQRREEEPLPVTPPPSVLPPLPHNDMLMAHGSGGIGSSSSSYMGSGGGESRRGVARTGAAVSRIGLDMPRYYEQSGLLSLPQTMPHYHLSAAEYRVVQSIEAQLGGPLREDGPTLGVEFDPLPPGAFGAPIAMPTQQKQPARSHDNKILERHEGKATKSSALLPTTEHSLFSSSSSRKKKIAAGSSHSVHQSMGSRAVHEYQFLPEQPTVRSDTYDKVSQSHLYDSAGESPSTRVPSLATSHLLHGTDHAAPSYTFQGQMSSASLLPQQGRQQLFSSGSTEYDNGPKVNSFPSPTTDSQFGLHQVAGQENPYVSSDRKLFHDEDISRWERKRKIDEARIAKEVEAHEKRIRKELEKQDILRRKREEQMRKEMERHDRERRKEEERMMKEKQKEEEKFQREQRRLLERKEKFLLKESRKAEKMRQKEEMRREKEAAKLKAANERATARRIAREYMELVEDERLELMELAASSKGLPSILALDSDTLQQLDLFRDMLILFPPSSVQLKRPFAIQPWTDSEENIANLLKVWKFFITFADVLGLWSFTLDEFVQALHDYESRLLSQLHVAVLKTIIKDIEDVARIPSNGLVSNQSSSVNPLGGHPQIVEGAYAWGFDICSWQRHLNCLTWPEVLRQLALAAGFGPQLKKRHADNTFFHDEDEGNDTRDIIASLRSGSAAQKAVTLMRERGYTHRRRSRHRLTPGTVKFAAFHVLSLEGSKGLTILEVAEKIQKSGLRDLTTSKTPEASIAAALSRDTKLFERTAPSTYCVRTPYRKDPAEADAILSAAREKIQVFQTALSDSEDAEKDTEDVDAEREDSEGDAADDAEVDVAITKPKCKNEHLENKLKHPVKLSLMTKGKEDPPYDASRMTSQTAFEDGEKALSLPLAEISQDVDASQTADINSNCQESGNDMEDTEVDENNSGEPWVESLSRSDYSDLCVEERLNALVALIGVANQGNTLRIVLESRLEAATSLKKQMWSEAQLDRRRFRDEYSSRMQYNVFNGYRSEGAQANGITEGSQIPLDTMDKDNDRNLDAIDSDQLLEQQNAETLNTERNSVPPEVPVTDTLQVQQYGYGPEKSRSQIKSYIGHKAEQLYVYRSLPLGLDRRRNRYWQFSTSASPNDPGSGRILFESRDGHWKVIDSEEVFDALMGALDTRGIRESHLHSMLQRIEPTFKESIRRRKQRVIEMYSSSDIAKEFASPSSSPYGAFSDALGELASFHIELGRNDIEKDAALKRYHGFVKWMWRECYNPITLSAIEYGKKRCSPLLQTCECCYQSFLAEDKHCPSCHKTFKSLHNSETFFSDHVAQCEQKRKVDPDWMNEASDSSLPIGIGLLKAQLSIIEVSIPADALQPFWTEGYRKSWGVKLHSSSSAAEIFQILTLLESAIKRNCLSSNFETTNELLNSSTSEFSSDNVIQMGSVPVLPWVPDTIAAVALRLLDLDTSISYMMQSNMESQKEKPRDYVKLPSRYAFVKNTQELELIEASERLEYQNGRMWLDSGGGRRGRGRGSRGNNRGGRGRGRRSRGLRGNGSFSRAATKDENAINLEKATTKYTKRGRTRGRGQKRGRRSARPRQISQGKMAKFETDAILRSFNVMGSSRKRERTEESSRSSGEDWGLKDKRPYVDEDDNDNDTGYQSDENGHASEEDYDDQVADYARVDYDATKPTDLMDDDMEDDEMEPDAEGDEEIEEYDGDQNENGVDVDMDDEDEEIEDDADVGDNDADRRLDDDEEGSSFSSEYSD